MPPTSECNIKENQGQDANYCGDNGILLLHKERSHVQNDLKSLTVQNKLFEKRGESDEFLSFSLSLSVSLSLSLARVGSGSNFHCYLHGARPPLRRGAEWTLSSAKY